ncbi:MAG: hypothetical protein JWN71_3231 [Xanthobacteraceae bacterium]|nr:hypothetical protein [Xanthobacteraceae bacterium]
MRRTEHGSPPPQGDKDKIVDVFAGGLGSRAVVQHLRSGNPEEMLLTRYSIHKPRRIGSQTDAANPVAH